jgi:hypothetical protein
VEWKLESSKTNVRCVTLEAIMARLEKMEADFCAYYDRLETNLNKEEATRVWQKELRHSEAILKLVDNRFNNFMTDAKKS